MFDTEPQVEVDKPNRFKMTPLHIAAAIGYEEVVRYLIYKGANTLDFSRDGPSPLQLTSEGGHISVLKFLLLPKAYRYDTPFEFAAKEGHVLMLKSLIAGNPLPRQNGLLLAASHGRSNVVEYLLERGADPNGCIEEPRDSFAEGRSPLAEAAYKGHRLVIQKLLIGKANVNLASGKNNDTPLHYAASRGNLEAVSELLRFKSCNFNARNAKKCTPLHSSVEHPEVVGILLKARANQRILDEDGSTPLHKAATAGALAAVQILLEGGADVTCIDDSGYSPVIRAIQAEQISVAEYLLSEKKEEVINKTGISGRAPLHYAAQFGHVGLITRLLELKANPEAKDNEGRTPLHIAAESGQADAVAELLKYEKVLGDSKDNRGWSALHYATSAGHSNVTKLLLEAGVDINVQDEDLKSPLWLAAYQNSNDIAQQLLHKKANSSLTDENGWKMDGPHYTQHVMGRKWQSYSSPRMFI